jgi:hypothetical protein
MRICLRRKFPVHSMETLDRIRYTIGHFEVVAESAVYRESRSCELQTNGVSSQRGAPEQKDILTLRAETKAFLHDPPVNFDFAHCLKSGVRDAEWRVVERYRCKKSVAKCQIHNGGAGLHNLPEIQVLMGPVIWTSSSTVFTIFIRDSPASLLRPAAYRASQRCCWTVISRSSNFPLDICQGLRAVSMRCNIAIRKLTSETWARIWARARSKNRIAPSQSPLSMREFPRRRYY